MARDHVRAAFLAVFRYKQLDQVIQGIDKTIDASAVLALNHRVTRCRKDFSRTDHVRRAKKDHRVPIGVGLGHMVENYRLIVV